MFPKIWNLLLCLVLLAALFGISAPAAASPAYFEFFVNSSDDLDDYGNNSICEVLPLGSHVCTLRAAISEANYCDTDPNDCGDYVLIHVPAGTYTLSLSGANEDNNASGDLDFTLTSTPIIIEGAGAGVTIIDANSLDRVFHVHSGTVALRNLTIRGGRLEQTAAMPSKTGAGVSHSGSWLELDNVIIEDNTVVCLPEVNPSECYQGVGGGVFASEGIGITASTIRNNHADRGSAFFYNGITQINIFSSTISGNQAPGGGTVTLYGPVMMINSTISNNSATAGGGIMNYSNLMLFNVTLASNYSQNGGYANIYNNKNIEIYNTIIAYPLGAGTASNCLNGDTWISGGYNLYSDASCPASGTGDLQNSDPKLTPLAWLGGATQTRGLQPGSPAKDHRPGFCMDVGGGTVTIDQRGFNRDSLCDTGAFEGIAYAIFLPIIGR